MDYEVEIIKLDEALIDYPDNIPLQNRLKYRLGKWVGLLDIILHVASNEGTPWLERELGYTCVPMELKKTTQHTQVGDYQAYIKDYDMWCSMLVERKTCADLYGSLMRSENRIRLYSEIMRYERDSRFTQMVIIAECALADFLIYVPSHNGKRRNVNHTGANTESRRATIAGLYARGVPVIWAGSRSEAQKTYLQLVRQSCIKNYKSILRLE